MPFFVHILLQHKWKMLQRPFLRILKLTSKIKLNKSNSLSWVFKIEIRVLFLFAFSFSHHCNRNENTPEKQKNRRCRNTQTFHKLLIYEEIDFFFTFSLFLCLCVCTCAPPFWLEVRSRKIQLTLQCTIYLIQKKRERIKCAPETEKQRNTDRKITS